MVGLSLPRLHSDIERTRSCYGSDLVMLDALKQRVQAGQSILSPGVAVEGSLRPSKAFTKLLRDQLDPVVDELCLLDGNLMLETGNGREALSHYEDGFYGGYPVRTFSEHEVSLAWAPDRRDGAFWIGKRLRLLDEHSAGTAETVLAFLEDANDVLYRPMVLPSFHRELCERHYWGELEQRETLPVMTSEGPSYERADEAALSFCLEFMGGDEADAMLPSEIDAGIRGHLSITEVMRPAKKVTLAVEAFVHAGLNEAAASDVIARLHDLAGRAVALKEALADLQGVHAGAPWIAAVFLADRDDGHIPAHDVIDDDFNMNMESGYDGTMLRMSLTPQLAVRKPGRRKASVPTPVKDGLAVMANYINLTAQFEKVLAVLDDE